MSNLSTYLRPVLESGIKKQLGIRLAMVAGGGPIKTVLSWAIMKYIITPFLDESQELIEQQVNKVQARRKLKEVNNATTDAEFDTAFNKL